MSDEFVLGHCVEMYYRPVLRAKICDIRLLYNIIQGGIKLANFIDGIHWHSLAFIRLENVI